MTAEITLTNLGCVACDLGRLAEARTYAAQALAQCREHGNRPARPMHC